MEYLFDPEAVATRIVGEVKPVRMENPGIRVELAPEDGVHVAHVHLIAETAGWGGQPRNLGFGQSRDVDPEQAVERATRAALVDLQARELIANQRQTMALPRPRMKRPTRTVSVEEIARAVAADGLEQAAIDLDLPAEVLCVSLTHVHHAVGLKPGEIEAAEDVVRQWQAEAG